MNGKKLIITLVFAILAITIGYGVYNYSPVGTGKPNPLEHPPIDLNEVDNIYFFKGGFATTGKQNLFFNNKGLEIPFPFSFDEGEEVDEPSITSISDNYVLVNEGDIYRIKDNTLEKIYSLEDKAFGIDEVGKDLILLIKDENSILHIKGFSVDNLVLKDLIPNENDYFIDYDIGGDPASLSILTLNVQDPFPVSQAYHLGSDFGLFGAISHNDEAFYRIFRFPERVILIGNQRVVCYNIEGEMEWELKNLGYDNLIVSANDSGILIYSKFPFSNNEEDENEYNGLFIAEDGNRNYLDMPKQLSRIIAYGNRFLCVQYNKNVLVMNNRGRVIKEYPTEKHIKDILYNPSEPKYLYLVHSDNRLQVYSTIEEEK